MKSTSSACSTSASTKCPMRTLAITGIVNVAMISRITLIDAIRATPPSLRISDRTRSSAITAHAPAFSPIFACSAFATSMITPPLSISARPTFTRHSFDPLLPLPLAFVFFASIVLLLSILELHDGVAPPIFSLPRDHHESALAPRKNLPSLIPNLAHQKKIASFLSRLVALDDNLLVHAHGLQVFHVQLRRHRANLAKPANLAHRLVQQQRDNSAMRKSSSALVPLA